jgi:hypothetical protein
MQPSQLGEVDADAEVDQFAPMQLQPRDRTFLPGTRRLAAAAGSPAEADGHALGKSAESRPHRQYSGR